jgi:macrodomain Ter protein organizer (MatP/YcbG family)
MRTSINLDDDAYQLASLYAKGRGITLSAAINEVVRKIGESRSESNSSRIKTAPNGLKVIAANGRVITPEMIKQAEEDEFA